MTDKGFARSRIRRLAMEMLDWLRGCDFHIDMFDQRPFLNRVRSMRHYIAAAELEGETGCTPAYIEETADMLEQGRYMPSAERLSNIIRNLT